MAFCRGVTAIENDSVTTDFKEFYPLWFASVTTTDAYRGQNSDFLYPQLLICALCCMMDF